MTRRGLAFSKSPSEGCLLGILGRACESGEAENSGRGGAASSSQKHEPPRRQTLPETVKGRLGLIAAENSRRDIRGCSRSWESGFMPGVPASKDDFSTWPSTPWDFPDSEGSSQSSRPSGEGADSSRRSLESNTSSQEENQSDSDHFEMEDRVSLSEPSGLSRRFSVNLGISLRKSLLCTLSERDAAQEAQDYGTSQAGIMPRPVSPTVAFPARRCNSFADAQPVLRPSHIKESVDSDDEDGDWLHMQVTDAEKRAVSLGSTGRAFLSEGQAAAELFFRLNHARQTVTYVRNQAAEFSKLSRGDMGVWDALELLNGLREYETALLGQPDLDPNMPLLDHCFQTAEACRLVYPQDDWLHLVGLLHSLGKLLASPRIAGEPQWAVCGESFPVGCRFDAGIACSQFFSVNPDRRSRLYNTPTGMYKPGQGLASVFMSWSAAEYLYMLLLLNRTLLPPQALFIIRYQKFLTLDKSDAYRSLMGRSDRRMLPWLERFRKLAAYKQVPLPGALQGSALRAYYSKLIEKYIPGSKLRF